MIINKDYMKIMKAGKNWTIMEPRKHNPCSIILGVLVMLCVFMFLVFFFGGNAYAYTLDQWANAIHKAEGNDNYGILSHYKHTTPRQACKNTVKHQYRLWKQSGQQEPFLTFLGESYCPIGASNDPTGLNKNWIRNVSYFLKEGT